MPRAWLKRARCFSQAIAAVSSTSCAHADEHPAVVHRRPHRLGVLAKATPGEPVREAHQQTRILFRQTEDPAHSVLLTLACGGPPRTRRRRTPTARWSLPRSEGHHPHGIGEGPTRRVGAVEPEAQQRGDDPHGPRVTPLVVDDLLVDLLRGQEPLLWGIALASGSDLQRGMSLEVAVPVGPLAPPRGHDRLP